MGNLNIKFDSISQLWDVKKILSYFRDNAGSYYISETVHKNLEIIYNRISDTIYGSNE